MIVTTDAIVLRVRKHGETSKIVALYTREFGLVSVIAKGARETKSKFGGSLEMFAELRATFYKKERTEPGLYLLSKTELQSAQRGILGSLEAIESATGIVELLLRSLHDEEQNTGAYDLLQETLASLSSHPQSFAALQLKFYVAYARIAGFAITSIPSGVEAGRRYLLRSSTGEVLDATGSAAGPSAMELSPSAVATLRHLATETIDGMLTLRMSATVYRELRNALQDYLTHHLAALHSRSLKSSQAFRPLPPVAR